MNKYCMVEIASDNIEEINLISKKLLDKKSIASSHVIESLSGWNWNKKRT